MASAASYPHLRLVRGEQDAAKAWKDRRDARAAIMRENHAAAQNAALEPTDPRWVLAMRTQGQLQNGALSPERRRRILRLAHVMGMRPFDANVVIAIVQDHARSGLPLAHAAGTLSLVHRPDKSHPENTRTAGRFWIRWAAALFAAGIATLLLIRWVMGG